MSITTPRALALVSCALGLVGLVGLSGCEKEPPASASAATQAPIPETSDPTRQSRPSVTPAALEVDFDSVEVAPGWIATISGTDGRRATSLMPTASFTLESGESLHPRVAPAGLSAEYAATLMVPTPGTYRLVAEAEGGRVSARCFDAVGNEQGVTSPARVPRIVQTDWMQLADEPHTILVSFQRDANDPARLRLMWERQGVGSDGFVAEAIPTALVSVPSESTHDAARATLAMEGRVLLGELGCVSCHATDSTTAHGVFPRQAPLLGEISRRAHPQWIREWIADPQLLKPGAGMPDVFLAAEGQFHQGADADEIEAITNYLVSLGGPVSGSTVTEDLLASESSVQLQGAQLYHSVGCVSCHGPLETATDVYGEPINDLMPEVDPPHPFGMIMGKWDPEQLAEFLVDPARTHPGGRMPSMNLSKAEADLIAIYLTRMVGIDRRQVVPPPFEFDQSQIEMGKAAFTARGCANCHEIGHNQAPVQPGPMSVDLAGVIATKGPMDPNDTVHIKYDLTKRQRDALRVAIEEIQQGAEHPAPLDDATLRMSALNCLACHAKDERGGLADGLKPYFRTEGEAELGDEGRFPPHLSGVGFKLTTPWLREVLTDAGSARPYMSARMPQFGDAQVRVLAEHLAAIDGVHPNSDDTEPQSTDEMVMAGRTLSGEGGLNCISCHVFSDLPPAGLPGPDMTKFAERLRYAWWRDYLLNPPRYKPGTRMPLFYYSGRGAVTDVYNGDPHRQADAMWAYFALGDFMPVPEGLEEGDGLALRVGERPVVFRTYLEDAGSRAIAVGFPIGLHFAFDADKARLVDAWKGEFINATSAWKGRGGNYADGQGSVIWEAPAGPTIEVGDNPTWAPDAFEAMRFRGYRFDENHVPVFRYEYTLGDGRVQFEERIEPVDVASGAFKRQFAISDHGGRTIWIKAGPAAAGVIAAGADVETDDGVMAIHPHAPDPITVTLEVRP